MYITPSSKIQFDKKYGFVYDLTFILLHNMKLPIVIHIHISHTIIIKSLTLRPSPFFSHLKYYRSELRFQKTVEESIGFACYVLNFFSRCRALFCSLPKALSSSQQFNTINYNQLYFIPQTHVTSFRIIFFGNYLPYTSLHSEDSLPVITVKFSPQIPV